MAAPLPGDSMLGGDASMDMSMDTSHLGLDISLSNATDGGRGGGGGGAGLMGPTTADATAASDADLDALAVGNLGLARLKAEPRRLETERNVLADKVNAFALQHYRVHIENHQCATLAREETAKVAPKLSVVKDAVPKLVEGLAAFAERATEVRNAHQRLRRTLQHHTQLLELLEVPQLMETCVRNGLFDEALELCEFASTLYRRHRLAEWRVAGARAAKAARSEVASGGGGGSAGADAGAAAARPAPRTGAETDGGQEIVYGIVCDVRESAQAMTESLLQQLQSKISLPACLRVVGCLRRLYTLQFTAAAQTRQEIAAAEAAADERDGGAAATAAATAARVPAVSSVAGIDSKAGAAVEARLRSEFLAARGAWHEREVDAAQAASPGAYISKVADMVRTHWGDIITQYRALFPDSSPAPAASARGAVEGARRDTLLHRWVMSRLRWLVNTLQRTLAAIDDGASLASALEVCTYAASRTARVGADFRAFLPPLFEARAISLTGEGWARAAELFAGDLKAWTWAQRLPSVDDAGAGFDDDGTARGAGGDAAALMPPKRFLHFAPLADVTNGFLATLNELRQCAPVTIVTSIGIALHEFCDACADGIVAAAKLHTADIARHADEGVEPMKRFKQLCEAFDGKFLPYTRRCTAAVLRVPADALPPLDTASAKLEAMGLIPAPPALKPAHAQAAPSDSA